MSEIDPSTPNRPRRTITGSGDLRAQPSKVSGTAKISINLSGRLSAKGKVPPKKIEVPGEAIDRFLSVFLAPRFYKRVVEPRIADWQWEHHAAKSRGEGRIVLGWIWLRNFAGLFYALLKRPIAFLFVLSEYIDRLKP